MKSFSGRVAQVVAPLLLTCLLAAPALGATFSKVIPASEFKAQNNYAADDVTWIVNSFVVGNNSSSSRDAWFWAPVKIPVGATLTGLSYITYNPTGGSTFAFLRRAMGWGTDLPSDVATVSFGTAQSVWQVVTVDATSTRVVKGDVLSVYLRLAPNTQVRAVKVIYRR